MQGAATVHAQFDIGGSLGVGARAAIDDEFLGEVVRREQAQAWDMNISGVPAMIVQGKFLIPGAQEPEVYANALRRVVANKPVNNREKLAAYEYEAYNKIEFDINGKPMLLVDDVLFTSFVIQ